MENLPHQKLLEQLRDFIHQEVAYPLEKISAETTLRNMGLDGDDAGDFMAAYAEKFEVDLTDFVFENYFDIEGGFNPLFFMYLALFKPEKIHKKQITVNCLMDSAISKKWKI